MQLSHQLIGQLTGGLAVVSVIPYIVSIFRGVTKPSRATYAIWTAINVVNTASYIASGGQAASFARVAFTFTAITIFFLSLKYGMGGLKRLDLVCLGLAAVAIALWVTTHNPVTALYTGMAASLLGFIPTIKKSYFLPETENLASWSMALAATSLSMFAVASWRVELVFPLILSAVGDAIVVGFLIKGRMPIITQRIQVSLLSLRPVQLAELAVEESKL